MCTVSQSHAPLKSPGEVGDALGLLAEFYDDLWLSFQIIKQPLRLLQQGVGTPLGKDVSGSLGP